MIIQHFHQGHGVLLALYIPDLGGNAV